MWLPTCHSYTLNRKDHIPVAVTQQLFPSMSYPFELVWAQAVGNSLCVVVLYLYKITTVVKQILLDT